MSQICKECEFVGEKEDFYSKHRCKKCWNEKCRQYYREHIEKLREYQKTRANKYYHENNEEMRERNRKYYKKYFENEDNRKRKRLYSNEYKKRKKEDKLS